MRELIVAFVFTGVLAEGAAGRAQSPAPACRNAAAVFEAGLQAGVICAEEAQAGGYTIVDLSDDWVPDVLSEPEGAPETLRQGYRDIYVALANEQPVEATTLEVAERPLELFGVFPSFRALRERALDDARHACHDAVNDASLVSLEGTLSPWQADVAEQRNRIERARKDERSLERERERRGLDSIDDLAAVRGYAYMVKRFRHDRAVVDAISAAQAHLACSRALTRSYERGVFDSSTAAALRAFAAEHMVISSGALDSSARALLLVDSRELVFRAALRALRERVAAATSIIEDGSATGRFGKVLGRDLDPPELRAVAAFGPLADGAEDLIAPMTDAAARSLGWSDPEGFVRFFDARGPDATRGLTVALRLPPRPSYHAPHMELRAEIDRGDVWYQYPYRADRSARPMPVVQRPTLVLFARVGGGWKPLARYMTTIGGWQRERIPSGVIGLRYKESPVGTRLWRDVIAAPAWLPPSSTPDADLLQRVGPGRDRVKRELLGPGYRSAYGLAMLVHLAARTERAAQASTTGADAELFGGDACCIDQGVRTHGSVSYASILRGYSHGCHRLFNHLALRLMGFLLAHRNHIRHGDMPVRYDRTIVIPHGARADVHVRSRGYRYELTPPVAIEVLEGRIRGPVKRPIRGLRPLP